MSNEIEVQYLHQMINMHREAYEKAIKPYLDRLAFLEALKGPAPVIIPMSPESSEQIRGWFPSFEDSNNP